MKGGVVIPKHLSFERKKKIAAYYKTNPMTIGACAEAFSISPPSVIKILNMFKVQRWTKAKLYSPELDEHYFDQIDTPQKAYWLGLITTDGCIFEKRGKTLRLCLTLKTEDEYLMRQFLSDIRCNKKIVHTQNRTESSVQICSNTLCNALSQYGVVPRKTGMQKFFCPQYTEAYLHGLIDGDGSISFYSSQGRRSHHKSIRLCAANRDFLEDVIAFIGCGRIEKSHEGLDTITWSSNDDMMSVIEAVNTYPTSCLIRKKLLMDKIVEEIGKYRDNRQLTAL